MLIRNLATSLLLYENVRTTRARAKAVRPIVDRMIAKAKAWPPHIAVRFLHKYVTDKNAAKKIFEVLIERYKDRPSGFTRTKPIGLRKGDGAELVEISLVDAATSSDNPAK